MHALCRTSPKLRECFPHAHQSTTGLLLNSRFYAMTTAHRSNLRGVYQHFPNRTNAACSCCCCVSSTKVLCCSGPSFTLHNSGILWNSYSVSTLCKSVCAFHKPYERAVVEQATAVQVFLNFRILGGIITKRGGVAKSIL